MFVGIAFTNGCGSYDETGGPTLGPCHFCRYQPGLRAHPGVVSVMHEVGVDLSSAHPQFLSGDLADAASHLITMGCGDSCPYIAGLHREDWPLEEPKQMPMARVREIRDDIEQRVWSFLQREGLCRAAHHR
jgi:arsenate reductase (thioredoxin)